MGIENLIEEAAGVLAAEKALEAADPGAGFLAKAAAAVAGYEGVEKIKEHLAAGTPGKDEATPEMFTDGGRTG